MCKIVFKSKKIDRNKISVCHEREADNYIISFNAKPPTLNINNCLNKCMLNLIGQENFSSIPLYT